MSVADRLAAAAGEAQEPECDTIGAALHRHRVHDGFAPQRAALATQCMLAGINEDDIDLLAEGLSAQRKQTSDSAAAILASILSDPKAALVRIADMKRGRQLRQAKVAKTYPGQSNWIKPDAMPTSDGDAAAEARWLRARLQRQAGALVVTEKKPVSLVAQLLQISEAEVRVLVEMDRASR